MSASGHKPRVGLVIAKPQLVFLLAIGLSPPKVHIDGKVWYLDVGSFCKGNTSCVFEFNIQYVIALVVDD